MNGDDIELVISNLHSTNQPLSYDVTVSGLVMPPYAVQNFEDNDSSTGVYCTSYEGTTKRQTDSSSTNFVIQFLTKTAGVTLTGIPS